MQNLQKSVNSVKFTNVVYFVVCLYFHKKMNIFVKTCENAHFYKNSYFPFFGSFCPKILHEKNVATPKKTTYFARSAQEWPVRKKGLMDLPKLAKIYREFTFLGMFFVNSLHSETGSGHMCEPRGYV